MESTSTKSLAIFLFSILIFCSNHNHVSSSSSSSSPNPSPVFPKQALPTKSGYLPVSHTSDSAIFYTFYEAQIPTSPLSQTPLLIWLQGGPGCSSMIGNFFELGPWRVTNSLTLEPNPASWNRIFGLIFLDNPIGTGFSIASTPSEIPRNQKSVAKHLFDAIAKFIQLEPDFKNRPIYITGESYAGKYVPAIGYHILHRNSRSSVSQRVNLAGVAIGDGLTDPVTQVATHAKNAYYIGLINERQKNEVEKSLSEVIRLTKMGNWSAATSARGNALNLLTNMTGLATLYDYTRKAPYDMNLVTEFLKSSNVKRALGVNESIVFEGCSDDIFGILNEDLMKSVKHMVEYLVKRTKVLLYQGQYDLKLGAAPNEAWVKTMKWEGIEKFLNAERRIWKVNGEVAGYVQKWGGLTNVVVSGGGHLLPADQPLNSQVMMEDWILERTLFEYEQQGVVSEI